MWYFASSASSLGGFYWCIYESTSCAISTVSRRTGMWIMIAQRFCVGNVKKFAKTILQQLGSRVLRLNNVKFSRLNNRVENFHQLMQEHFLSDESNDTKKRPDSKLERRFAREMISSNYRILFLSFKFYYCIETGLKSYLSRLTMFCLYFCSVIWLLTPCAWKMKCIMKKKRIMSLILLELRNALIDLKIAIMSFIWRKPFYQHWKKT